MTHTYARGVKAVVFFNQTNDITISPTYPLNWSVGQSAKAVQVVGGEIGKMTAM